MDRKQLSELIDLLYEQVPGNEMNAENHIFRMFDHPLMGIADAADPLFEQMKDEKAVGPWFRGPKEWLPEAQSVVSLFFPMTEKVRISNRTDAVQPSLEWLCCRIEGQAYIRRFTEELQLRLNQTCGATAPSLRKEFRSFMNVSPEPGRYPETYGSNWSERHAGYICGLGTFGLSRGLITAAGIAGRMTSVILNAKITPDVRPYKDLYEYCIHCGRCIDRCPVGAITAGGKSHPPCHQKLLDTKQKFSPRLGCGKCQTDVPCEHGIPTGAEIFAKL